MPGVQVDFDDLFGTPKFIRSTTGILSEERVYDPSKSPPPPHGAPPLPPQPHTPDKSDRYRMLKSFLNENTDLFGYDASILTTARITRECVTPSNKLRTVVWQQELDDIPVFEAILIANFTRVDALVSLSSQVVPDLSRAVRANAALISAADAVALAARNIGEEQAIASDFTANEEPRGNKRKQEFTGEPIVGETEASFVLLPMDRSTLRLCWRVVLTGKQSGKLFQVLIDAASGEVMVRHCWTSGAVEATYSVFDKDSAAPLLPGLSTPLTSQASVTTQVNLTLIALSTNASPAGWVNTNTAFFGLTNTTFGNNVDAHLDWTNAYPAYGTTTNIALPRPIGILTNGRVEFTGAGVTVDFNQFPTNAPSRDAAVVNAFYWCNWLHDVFYDLGFTEAAGNFQYDNFGRGGANSPDAVQMHVQKGAAFGYRGTGFASGSPQDGNPGRIEISLWGGTAGGRDGVLDATLILHEYTHLITRRLVGGGVGITAIQTMALDEGWADFYAIALLSEMGDDPSGTYQFEGYAGFRWASEAFESNYYFGTRAYPYSTDKSQNPMSLGFLQKDPAFDPFPGTAISPLYNPTNIPHFDLNEAHTQCQVWCVTLWDARACLIQKYGFENGNWLMLQFVTDGMKIGPANPSFLEARDAVLQADLVNTGGQNQLELWTAFAKRGMGYSATNAPADFTDIDGLIPVRESFSIPPFVEITNAIFGSPAIGTDGTVYVGSTNGRLYALVNGSTNEFAGRIKWSFGGVTTNQPFNSSPAISPTGVIYAGCYDSNLYAIASSGAMIWRTNLGDKIFSSPALATDGTIYVGCDNGKFYAVNPNGTVKWSVTTGGSLRSSPAVALNGTVYFGSMVGTNNLYALNPTNGAALSGWPVTIPSGVYSSPAIGSDGGVFVGGLDGKVYAVNTNGTAKSGWPVTTGGAVYSSPAIASNGVVYVGSTDTNLYALNPNGTTNWMFKTRGAIYSSPALGRDGTLFVGSDDFNLHVVNTNGTGRWAYPIGGPVFSSPVIGTAGGLFVGSTAGSLYYLPTGTPFADGPWPAFRQNHQHTANAKTMMLRPPQTTNNTFKFEISGPVGAMCDVEVTTSLPPSWSVFTTLTLTNGVGIIETSSTNSQRYYRAKFNN